jgi:hypothetical protein
MQTTTTAALLATLAARVVSEGGYTADRRTLVAETLAAGFVVGAAPECEAVLTLRADGTAVLHRLGREAVPHRTFASVAEAIAWWLAEVAPPAPCADRIGAWLSGGDLYLDVSAVVESRETAIAIGRVLGERALWDAAAGKAIDIDDEGGA